MARFDDQSASIYWISNSKSDFLTAEPSVVVLHQIFTATQTEMESQSTKRIEFITLLTLGIAIILCSVLTLITQVISYFIFYPDRYETIDLLGIAIWGPVLLMLVCGGCFLSDLLNFRKFTLGVIRTALIVSAAISFATAGLSIYSTVQNSHTDSARKILGGMMASACLCVGISSTFLAAYTCRGVFQRRTEIIPPTLHYIAQAEARNQL